MIRKNRILVTGATGFIGYNLVQELAKNGNDIKCLVQPGDEVKKIEKINCKIIYGDVTKKESLKEAVQDVEYVFHLAAILGSNNSDIFFKINVEGTENIVQACLENNISLKRFLFVSSIAAIGPTNRDELLNEESPCNPLTPYGKSKLLAENYLSSLNGQIPFSIIRLPLVYGPGSNGGLLIFYKLFNKRIKLDVPYGESNVCYVKDAVIGMIQAAKNRNTVGNTYILGEKSIYSRPHILNLVSKVVGKRSLKVKIPFFIIFSAATLLELYAKISKSIPAFSRDEAISYLKFPFWRFDTKKSFKDFGFQVHYPLEKGVKVTGEWYRRNGFL